MNLELLTTMIIAAQVPVVAVISVITWKLSISLRTEEFKIIRWSWLVGLIYVFFNAWYSYSQFALGYNQSVTMTLEKLIPFVDAFQFALLSFALTKAEHTFPFQHRIKRYGWFIVFLFALAWMVSIIPEPLLQSAQIGGFRFIPAKLPSIILNIFALSLSALFYHKVFIGYKRQARMLEFGTVFYCIIQTVAFIHVTGEPVIVNFAGWLAGFLSKGLICFGLLQIFRQEAVKSKRLERILAGMFHELRNALLGINTPVRRILYEGNVNTKTEVRHIEQTYELMASIIDATWLMYKNDLDKVSVETDEINMKSIVSDKRQHENLNTLVQIAVKIVDSIANRSIKFSTNYGANCLVLCYRHEVIQVIVNLLKNSYESFHEGMGNIYITTRRVKTDDNPNKKTWPVILEIVDDGQGIPLEVQDKIFNLGFTTKGEKGSGIGLNMVQQIIQSNFGSIELESPIISRKSSGGTKFIICFNNQNPQTNVAEQADKRN